jgi:hypothetical protein
MKTFNPARIGGFDEPCLPGRTAVHYSAIHVM